MILIFSGPDHYQDTQIELLLGELGSRGVEYEVLNPFAIQRDKISILQQAGALHVSAKGKRIKPVKVYVSARWRSDSLVQIPGSIKYPGAYRSQISQLMQDLRFALDECEWFPGKIEAIERAESKPFVLREAYGLGIRVPRFTLDSFSSGRSAGAVYRKNLGFPFVVSINKKKGVEVGVTTLNSVIKLSDGRCDSRSPWQWQSLISAVRHVRCCVVGERVWGVSSDYPLRHKAGVDFREINQIQDRETLWETQTLPLKLRSLVVRLNKKLGVSLSCPEFLVDRKGRWYFIDLNPCGDWGGFFPKDTNRQIANSIATLLSPG